MAGKKGIKKALGTQGTIDFGEDSSEPIVVSPISESGAVTVKDGQLKTIGDATADDLKKQGIASTLEDIDQANAIGSQIDNEVKTQQQPFDVSFGGQPAITSAITESQSTPILQAVSPTDKPERVVPKPWVQEMNQRASAMPPSALTYGAYDRRDLRKSNVQSGVGYSGNIPKPVDYIDEQLGMNQYFPELGRSTAVGSYSRKTLGSGNIYVAGGGVLPFGLLDARKRSLQRQAAQVAALNKDVNYSIETAPQFQEIMNQSYFNFINDSLDKTGGNYSQLEDPRSPTYKEFQAENKSWIDRMKLIKDLNGKALSLVGQINEDAEKGVVANIDQQSKALQQWLNPSPEFIDKILSGEEDLNKWAEKFNSFKAITPWADATANDLDLSQFPLNTKNMTQFEAAQGLQDVLRKSSGLGYDKYLSGVKEYIPVEKIVELVDAAFNDQNFYKGQLEGTPAEQEAMLKRQKEDAVRALVSRVAEKVSFKQDTVANDALEEKRLAFDKKQYEEGKITKYSFIQAQGNSAKSYWNSLMSDKTLTLNQRVQKMAEWSAQNGLNLDVAKTNQLGTPSWEVVMDTPEKEQPQGTNLYNTEVTLPTRDGKKVSVTLAMVLSGVAKDKHNVDVNSPEYKNAKADLVEIKNSSSSNGNLQYKPANRYHSLYSQEIYTNNKGQQTIVSVPLQKSNTANQQGISTMIVDDFNSVVKKNEKGEWVSVKLKGNYRTKQNLDDPAVQIGFDKSAETSDAKNNPNVPRL